MPRLWEGRHDHLVQINITARSRDMAADGSFRRRMAMAQWIDQAIRLKHFRDRMDEIHRRHEEAREQAQEKEDAPTRLE